MNNECRYCSGQLKEQSTTRVQEYKGNWYILENVPALVYQQCAATYFTPETHDAILDLITSNIKPVRMEQVAVLDAGRAL